MDVDLDLESPKASPFKFGLDFLRHNLTDTQFLIGIGAVGLAALILYFSQRPKGPKKTLLDPTVKYPLKLVEKTTVSHDTFIFRFELPTPQHILGLPTGQHVHIHATINGQMVVRKYTPVSSDDDLGYMDLIVKVYFKDVHPKFPEGGKLTQYLNDLPIGATVDFRGPAGRLTYKGAGEFAIKPEKSKPADIYRVKKVNMIAGGSGITPMLQIIKAVFKEENNDVQLSLVFANQTEADILCREDLEQVLKDHPNQFKLWYTLDRPPTDWKYSQGFISDTMLKDVFHPPSADTMVLMCGPPPMINFACNPALEKLGYDKKQCFAY